MKVGILRETKTPPDRRVPLTPEQCVEVMHTFPEVKIVVQTSPTRCFSDDEYRALGIEVCDDLSDCAVLLGVKEVQKDALLPGKIYFFFSHTIKKQAYNRSLLQAVLSKNIQLVDYEVLTNKAGFRIIGFGRFAGLVGAYSGLRAYGLKHGLFELKPAHQCNDLAEMLEHLDATDLPPLKIAVTGDGRVAGGALEILDHLKIIRVSPEAFLNKKDPDAPIYVQLLPQNYVQRSDGAPFELMHFFNHPEDYENAFLPFAHATDLLIAAAYWDPKAPVLFSAADMRDSRFRIGVISDITCDIEGSIPSTKRAALIDDPFYDYNPLTEKLEAPFSSAQNVVVQAVDNLPCELPKDASLDFGRSLIDKVFPALFGADPDRIIERASICKDGKLSDAFAYLQDFADGK